MPRYVGFVLLSALFWILADVAHNLPHEPFATFDAWTVVMFLAYAAAVGAGIIPLARTAGTMTAQAEAKDAPLS